MLPIAQDFTENLQGLINSSGHQQSLQLQKWFIFVTNLNLKYRPSFLNSNYNTFVMPQLYNCICRPAALLSKTCIVVGQISHIVTIHKQQNALLIQSFLSLSLLCLHPVRVILCLVCLFFFYSSVFCDSFVCCVFVCYRHCSPVHYFFSIFTAQHWASLSVCLPNLHPKFQLFIYNQLVRYCTALSTSSSAPSLCPPPHGTCLCSSTGTGHSGGGKVYDE